MDDNAIRFILDGQVQTVSGVNPNTTVLNYLREQLRKTGTKEGCAEGDCGACTVVIADLHKDRVRFRAINACIRFLPTLHGKALFTVESLRAGNGDLHPVQHAMVDCHGSQCGFCTPGFVMSLFALYLSEAAPSRPRIQDVLAGNLCRCTGYRPIIDAASQMYTAASKDDEDWLRRPFSADAPASAGEQKMIRQLRGIKPQRTLVLSGPGPAGGEHCYFAPTSIANLNKILRQHPNARLLAGGTDVGLWVTKDHQDLETVIYLGNIDELGKITSSKSHVEIGAAATLSDTEAVLASHYPDLGELLRRFASPPIRNTATLGGNIANGSPIGDSMPALIVLGASLVVRKGDARGELPLENFYLDYRKTALASGEFVERLRVPIKTGCLFRAYKISKRFDQDISTVLGAFCMHLDGETITEIRICFGGMAATPKRATGCEAFLLGRLWTEENVEQAVAILGNDFAPIDDMRASSDYRQLVAGNLLRKFFIETSAFEGETRVLEHSH